MRSEKFYKLFANIALEYRVSLNNLCFLMNEKVTEENKKKIYDELLNSYKGNKVVINKLKYLFNVETSGEDLQSSKQALRNSSLFILKYKEAKKAKDTSSVKELLLKTETDFKEFVKSKDLNEPLTKEEAEIISKYRIKHVISREALANILGISRRKLERGDRILEDEVLKEKIEILNSYYLDLGFSSKRKNGFSK